MKKSIFAEVYDNDICPDCGENIPFDAVEGSECSNCGHVFWLEYPNSDA